LKSHSPLIYIALLSLSPFILFGVLNLLSGNLILVPPIETETTISYKYNSQLKMTQEITDSSFLSDFSKLDSRKPFLFIVGNSTARGEGHHLDTDYMNKALSEKYNVINTAISGGYLESSIDLSVYILEQLKERFPGNKEIHFTFLLSSVAFYDKWQNPGTDLRFLERYCQPEQSLGKFLSLCKSKKPLKIPNRLTVLENLKFKLFKKVRYYYDFNSLISWIKSGSASVNSLYIKFRQKLGKPVYFGNFSAERLLVLRKNIGQVLWLSDPKRIEKKMEGLKQNLAGLNAYLLNGNYNVKKTMILLPVSEEVIHLIKKPQQVALAKYSNQFLPIFRKGIPDLNFHFLEFLNNHDHYDHTHLNAEGQAKLVTFLKREVL
jgi:hypothetical protein